MIITDRTDDIDASRFQVIVDPWEQQLELAVALRKRDIALGFHYLRRDIERQFIEIAWQNHVVRSQARALMSVGEREV